MKIKSAEFVISNTKMTNMPEAKLPEYAFIGRSNVGKSSLINMLTGKKDLAKTSQTPGKTQLINHFIINENWFLVDLPGFGYARVSKSTKTSWEGFIKNYLEKRDNLQCVMVLIDSRLSPQKIDIEFVNWLGKKGIPFILVFTKADKQSKQKTLNNIQLFKKEMNKYWDEIPQQFITSAEDKTGKEELLAFIQEINERYLTLPEST